MCKSQKGKDLERLADALMLMSDELHNWLLFMALKVASALFQNRPGGLCREAF
jgi:hypothetical protein